MSDILAILARLSDWRNLLDFTLVALFFYAILRLIQGTQAMQLLRGILIVGVIVVAVSRTVELTAFGWLLRNSSLLILVAIPVIFQPELRRALERLGRGLPFLADRPESTATQELITQIVRACEQMANERFGALVVIEGLTSLGEYIERGIRVDGAVSAELLVTIFYPGTPLHDGAVIIREGRLAAASCVLPLTMRELADPQLGTRHRAAIGISEVSDAISIVVSEERGTISVARNGRIVRRIDPNRLRRILTDFFNPRAEEANVEPTVEAAPAEH